MRPGVLFLFVCCAIRAALAPPESVQDLIARLEPNQKVLWDLASQAFNEQKYARAVVVYKGLLRQLPGDAVLSKFSAEAALNSDDSEFALGVLKPLAADPNDWQAISLLARACAQTGDSVCRDSNMTRMLNLHRQGIAPPNYRQYILESLKLGDKTLTILPSLEPVGFYKVYDLGRVMDGNGKIFLRITIESGDMDQIAFAEEHPKEAAQGERAFTLDAYQETGLNDKGQRTQAHFTYKFYVGQPSYDEVRQAFIDIVNGKLTAMTRSSGLIVK